MPKTMHILSSHDRDPALGWPTVCGRRDKDGGINKPGLGRSFRDAGVNCEECLAAYEITPLIRY